MKKQLKSSCRLALHVLLGFFIVSVGKVAGITDPSVRDSHQMNIAPWIAIETPDTDSNVRLLFNVESSEIVKLQSPMGNLLRQSPQI